MTWRSSRPSPVRRRMRPRRPTRPSRTVAVRVTRSSGWMKTTSDRTGAGAGAGSGPASPSPLALDGDWRYFEGALPGIAANLALDEALLIEADERQAGPALRIWEPDEPAVVLGASRRWRAEVKVETCRAEGVAIARRSSGGGTRVIGPGTLNMAVVLPAAAAPGLEAVDRAQTFVLARIAYAIRALGPPVELHGSGDLTLGRERRKFAGSAQRRLRTHFLVHATFLYGFPLES